MTLETAERIVSEQGELANNEARAVVRGGMTICDRAEDGHRIYPWIKVNPTNTDDFSSIEIALKNYQERKKLYVNSIAKVKTMPVSADVKPTTPIQTIIDFKDDVNCLEVKNVNPVMELVEYIRKKFFAFVKAMDELVEE